MPTTRAEALTDEDLARFERDLLDLHPLEEGAEESLREVESLPIWRPSRYERHYVPGLRLVGVRDRATCVLQNTADLHVHTTWSDGDDLDAVLARACEVGLDVLAILDHDEVEGSLEARRRAHARRLPLTVVPGSEVSTREGHVGALFCPRRIPKGMSAARTVEAIHEAGGLAVAHHPYAPRAIEWVLRQRLGVRDLIMELPFDAVESTNAVPGRGRQYNLLAMRTLREAHVPVAFIGSSDAHLAHFVGKGRTFFGGNEGVCSLRAALEAGLTRCGEEYWSSGDKLKYYAHLVRAVVKNLLTGNKSVG